MSFPPLTFNAWLRYGLIRRIFRQAQDVRRVLEIGAGGGAVGVRLAADHQYVGVEQDANSYALARQRFARTGRGTILQGDVSSIEPGSVFDAVCAFEVVEHTQNDSEALTLWASFVRPGGLIVLSVPASQRRFGPWDEAVGHYRRYEPETMRRLLEECGLVEDAIYAYGFPLGYVLEAVRNRLARRRKPAGSPEERTASSGRSLQPPEWLGIATQIATAPFRAMQRPFERTGIGTGLVVAARRPQA
jgi:SAM-dependent methyltransferase